MPQLGQQDATPALHRADDAESFRAIVETLGDGIALVDAFEGRAVYVNDALCRLLQRDRAELLRDGGALIGPVIPAHLASSSQRGARAVDTSLAERRETIFTRRDGTHVDLEISIKSLEGDGLRLVAIVRDVTDRATAARALETAHAELEARVQERTAELTEAVRVRDEFLSIATHELKTPLSAMLLQLQLLTTAKGEARTSRVEKVNRSTRRLVRLVDVLLDVSRIATGSFELDCQDGVDLLALVREVNERFAEDAAQAGCELQVEGGAAARGCWDRFRLEQVYTNLLSNALKYGKGAPIEVRVAEQQDAVTLSVKDHGIGIAESELERVFARFERAESSRQHGGLGLGLYIAREIVTAHGGTIRIESQEGLGSELTVTLPRAPTTRTEGGRA